uniref:Uncharacterized protein n=2 Tax=Oryza TaxID=4527 RepID=Q109V5_ORYSJ|nr:hypothetical protein LOC_Os10g18084 [Oryza sativa Japonica Group]
MLDDEVLQQALQGVQVRAAAVAPIGQLGVCAERLGDRPARRASLITESDCLRD